MKKILTLCVLMCLTVTSTSLHATCLNGFQVFQNSGEVEVKRSGLVVEFPHSMDRYPEMEDRFVRWINRDKVLVSSVSMADNLCKLTFVDGVSEAEIMESLKFATETFGYSSFKVSGL
jgi:hypothetical protein